MVGQNFITNLKLKHNKRKKKNQGSLRKSVYNHKTHKKDGSKWKTYLFGLGSGRLGHRAKDGSCLYLTIQTGFCYAKPLAMDCANFSKPA